jgi:hypothetical protein
MPADNHSWQLYAVMMNNKESSSMAMTWLLPWHPCTDPSMCMAPSFEDGICLSYLTTGFPKLYGM